jgi:hypothetical protein
MTMDREPGVRTADMPCDNYLKIFPLWAPAEAQG